MTQRAPVAGPVEFVIAPDVERSRDGGGATIGVIDGRVVLRGPARASSASSASFAGSAVARVELLWLTPAEAEVLESCGDIDATRGLGAVLAPLITRLAGAGGVHDEDIGPGDRRRLAIMVRGLLSAVAGERVSSEDHDVTPQRRLAVLAMQLIHSQLADPHLSSASIALQLSVPLRTLQAAFRQAPGSIAESIRLLRLERAWIEIDTSPVEHPLDMAALGARWGFRGRDHFARAFERHYGVRPERARDGSRIAARS